MSEKILTLTGGNRRKAENNFLSLFSILGLYSKDKKGESWQSKRAAFENALGEAVYYRVAKNKEGRRIHTRSIVRLGIA